MLNAPRTGFAAFMPQPYAVTTPAASSQGVISSQIRGYPGNRPIASPPPAALDDGILGGPFNQPSRCSPDYFLPSLYWVKISSRLSMPGFLRTSTNVTPVKAPFIGRTPSNAGQYRTRVGGRTVTRWPRQFVRWPNYSETAQ